MLAHARQAGGGGVQERLGHRWAWSWAAASALRVSGSWEGVLAALETSLTVAAVGRSAVLGVSEGTMPPPRA